MGRFTCALAALLAIASAPIRADEGNARYVPIPVEGSLAGLFKERLQAAQAETPLLKIWNDIQRNPSKFKLDPALLKQFDLSNPALRGMLKELNEKHGAGAPFSAQDLAGLSKVLENAKFPQATNQRPIDAPHPTGESPAPQPRAEATAPREAPQTDRLDRWMRDLVDHAENTKVGDWLRNSPAFQKGAGDLRSLLDFKGNPSAWGLDSLPAHLRLTDKLNFRLPNGVFSGLKSIALPDLPHVNLPHMNLPSVQLGNWSLPAPPMPHIGGFGSATGAGSALLWLLVIGAGIVLIWQLRSNLRAGRTARTQAPRLGPWPIDPRKVTTRGQLVQAFDYLALLVLGTDVRSWNHRAISRKMMERKLELDAVEQLTCLYEAARYTAGPEPLTVSDQTLARRCLCLLAEVRAS